MLAIRKAVKIKCFTAQLISFLVTGFHDGGKEGLAYICNSVYESSFAFKVVSVLVFIKLCGYRSHTIAWLGRKLSVFGELVKRPQVIILATIKSVAVVAHEEFVVRNIKLTAT